MLQPQSETIKESIDLLFGEPSSAIKWPHMYFIDQAVAYLKKDSRFTPTPFQNAEALVRTQSVSYSHKEGIRQADTYTVYSNGFYYKVKIDGVKTTCTCKHYTYKHSAGGWCKHRIAVEIVQYALMLEEEDLAIKQSNYEREQIITLEENTIQEGYDMQQQNNDMEQNNVGSEYDIIQQNNDENKSGDLTFACSGITEEQIEASTQQRVEHKHNGYVYKDYPVTLTLKLDVPVGVREVMVCFRGEKGKTVATQAEEFLQDWFTRLGSATTENLAHKQNGQVTDRPWCSEHKTYFEKRQNDEGEVWFSHRNKQSEKGWCNQKKRGV